MSIGTIDLEKRAAQIAERLSATPEQVAPAGPAETGAGSLYMSGRAGVLAARVEAAERVAAANAAAEEDALRAALDAKIRGPMSREEVLGAVVDLVSLRILDGLKG